MVKEVDDEFTLTGDENDAVVNADSDDNMTAFDTSPKAIRVWDDVTGDITIENVDIDLEDIDDDTDGNNFYAIGVQDGEVGVHNVDIIMAEPSASHGILYQGGTVNVTDSTFETDSDYTRGIIIPADQGFDGDVEDISGNDFTGLDHSDNGRGITFNSGDVTMEGQDTFAETVEYILTENEFKEEADLEDYTEDEERIKFDYDETTDGEFANNSNAEVETEDTGELTLDVTLEAGSPLDSDEDWEGLTDTSVFELIDDDNEVHEADTVTAEPEDEDHVYRVEFSELHESEGNVAVRVLDVIIESDLDVDTTD